MSDYQGAIWSPNNNFDPDQGPKDHIVIHGTAGGSSAEGIAGHFRATEGTTGPVSTQYIVDQIGKVVQTVLERNVAWGNGTYPMNIRGISIEHVKSTPDNSAELTPIQEQTSFKLIQDIRTRHNIPIENIIPHSAVVATACPGPYPFDRMRNYLTGGNKPMKPSANQIKAANNRWNSILKNTEAGSAPTGSGIYEAWLADYVQGNKYHGPPLSHEYDSVDWAGNPVIVQEFAYGWVEWQNGAPNWYGPNGKLNV